MIIVINPMRTINLSDLRLSGYEQEIYLRIMMSKQKFFLIGSRYFGDSTSMSDIDLLTSSAKKLDSFGLIQRAVPFIQPNIKEVWKSSPYNNIDVWVCKNAQKEAEKMFYFHTSNLWFNEKQRVYPNME